jgi:large subunit ribosomal protein L13
MRRQKTYTPRPADIQRSWWVVDAAALPLGRMASVVAGILRGKHKPNFAPHMDGGDFVVVVNAEQVAVTGRKTTDKHYYRHSGYPGGLTDKSFEEMRAKHPERIVEQAVRGMLPRNRLGRQMYRKLKVYQGPEHPHAAQAPKPLEIDARKVS